MSTAMPLASFRNTASIDYQEAREAEDRVLQAISQLRLERNAWELDVYGYTVLTPDQVGPAEQIQKLRERVIATAELRHGIEIDLHKGITKSDAGRSREGAAVNAGHLQVEESADGLYRMPFGNGLIVHEMLFEGREFEIALMNPAVLALITYMLGESCYLNHSSGIIKQAGPEMLELHVDESGTPSPLPPYPTTANATWLLTDYSADHGSTCFVRGSNLLCRPPTEHEATNPANFEPVSAPAGSVMVWSGNTWHGALPRKTAGVRLCLVNYFARWNVWFGIPPNIHERTSAEMLERNPRRFRRLVGLDVPQLSRTPGVATMGRTAFSRFA